MPPLELYKNNQILSDVFGLKWADSRVIKVDVVTLKFSLNEEFQLTITFIVIHEKLLYSV